MLKVIDQVLGRYNCMSEEKRRVTRLRLKVQFGNGEMKDIAKIMQELSTYTSAITLFLNLLTMGSQGKVEEHMESHGEELRELRHSLNWITAMLQANNGNREGSTLTSYGEDDKTIWKEFRRELLKEGFSSEELRKHKAIIKDYVMELGSRGALDIPDEEASVLEVDRLLETQAGSGKEKEVEREDNPFPVSTQSSSRFLVSLPDDESSVAGPENHTGNHDAALLPPIGKGNITPKPVSIEEVEDEDFRSGSHPNCEDIGSLTDEYNFLHLEEYSDDEFTGSSDCEDDQSDEHDSSSPELSPGDWRNIPAPLWREAGTARHPPILTVADFGPERRRNESSTPSQRLADTDVAAASPIPRSDSPSPVAEFPGVDSHGAHTSTAGGPIPGISTAPKSRLQDSRAFPLWWREASAPQIVSSSQRKSLTAKALQQIPDHPFLAFKSKATLSTIAVHARLK
jgi:hypothetical protein